MSAKPHFNNIRNAIKLEIKDAKFSLLIAVGWFTDIELWNTVLKKAKEGIHVEVIVNDTDANRSEILLNKWKELIKTGSQIFIRTTGEKGLMHNKFCIIDLTTVIIGSYNWSKSAEDHHDENIIIIKEDRNLVDGYGREFIKLKNKSKPHFQDDIEEFKTEYFELISQKRDEGSTNLDSNIQFIKDSDNRILSVIIPYSKYKEINVKYENELSHPNKARIQPPEWIENEINENFKINESLKSDLKEKAEIKNIDSIETSVDDLLISEIDGIYSDLEEFLGRGFYNATVLGIITCSYSVEGKYSETEIESVDINFLWSFEVNFIEKSISSVDPIELH